VSDAPYTVLSHLPHPLVARVERDIPGARIVVVPMEGEPAPDVRGEVLLTHAKGSPNLARVVARGVRWVHAYGTGVEAFPYDALGDRPLTCSRGASGIPIAEWVLAVMLAFEKQLPERWLSAPPDHWSIAGLGGLHGRTLGLVGLGGIGREVATRALAFGMRVLAVRRSDAPSPIAGVAVTDLGTLLAEADHLVLAAATTGASRRMLDANAFARVKPGVHLVNVARGALVDHEALRAALDDGRVALASLDCVDPEPVPAGHWLYAHPKVRLSAHISWSMPGALDLLLDAFIENLRRDRAGLPLLDVVDRASGY
jgi:phosphoglycerate dehydrogenase-like enzyme